MGVNTNPDISATCTVTADSNTLPLYFIYPESQIKHATGNSVKQQRLNNVKLNFSNSSNKYVTNSNNPVANNITNHITNNIHIPDTDKHGNLYTTTKSGPKSMIQERLLNFINQVIIKHTDGTPAALFLDAASINRSDITREMCNKNIIGCAEYT